MSRGLLLLIVPLCLAAAGCAEESTEEFETTEAVAVTVATSRVGTIRDALRTTGSVRPAAGAELLVTAPQSARITGLPHAEGESVRKGELLAQFEIPSLAAEISARESDSARAVARLEAARAEAARLEGLFDRGIAARKEVEAARRDRAEAEAEVAAARSALASATLLRQRERVTAPFYGVVAGRWHNPGDLVEPSGGDAVLRFIDPTRLQVEVAVPVSDLARVSVGNPADVFGPGASSPEPGEVLSGPASVDTATGSAIVRVAFAKPTRLPAGTPVQVVVMGVERAGALLVPERAIVTEGPESFVFTVDSDGHAHRRAVSVGLIAGGDAQILSGLSAGERVILSGQEALPDGAAVTLPGS